MLFFQKIFSDPSRCNQQGPEGPFPAVWEASLSRNFLYTTREPIDALRLDSKDRNIITREKFLAGREICIFPALVTRGLDMVRTVTPSPNAMLWCTVKMAAASSASFNSPHL